MRDLVNLAVVLEDPDDVDQEQLLASKLLRLLGDYDCGSIWVWKRVADLARRLATEKRQKTKFFIFRQIF